jgi:hypothetical protein
MFLSLLYTYAVTKEHSTYTCSESTTNHLLLKFNQASQLIDQPAAI